MSISTNVEEMLKEFVGRQYRSQLNALMNKEHKTLEEHGAKLEFVLLPNTHYTIMESKVQRMLNYFLSRNTYSESVVFKITENFL